MRIGINARYLTSPYSGIGQYSINLLKSLAKKDKENEYFLFVPWPVDFDFGPNFKIIDLRELKLVNKDFIARLYWEQVQLGRAIKRYKIDLYHSLYQSMPFGARKIASIVTIHDAIPWRFSFQRKDRLYRWYCDISRNSCQRAYKAFAISETAKSDLTLVYGRRPEDIFVTYEPVNEIYRDEVTKEEIEKVKKKYKLTKPFMLYVGGFKRHKNLRFMIKAFAHAVHKFKLNIDIVIPGKIRTHSGFDKNLFFDPVGLKKYAKKKEVSSKVRFIGYADINDLAALYRASRLFISLSLYEGFGLPPLEAMTSGTPVIVSNTGAYPEIIADGGKLVFPHGENRIADAINRFFVDEEYYDQMKNQAVKRAKFFNDKKIADNVLSLYHRLYSDFTRENT